MVYKIEHRVGISTPIETVYDIVADVASWPQWSPIHRKAEGKLGFGATMTLEEYYEGLGLWEVTGVISDWVPLSHIHLEVPKPFYAGKLTRFFEFDKLTDTACTFSVGAVFEGFLSEREGRRFGPKIKPGLGLMCEALKTHAEAVFAADPNPPRSDLTKPREITPLVKRTEPVFKTVKTFGSK